eukprot:356164-Chlamydomonas_euryale.AAC.2
MGGTLQGEGGGKAWRCGCLKGGAGGQEWGHHKVKVAPEGDGAKTWKGGQEWGRHKVEVEAGG